MVRGHPMKTSSTSLPIGGPSDVSAYSGESKVVDKSTSHLDRSCKHLTRKLREPSKIFTPLDPKDMPAKTSRGTTLHTDPFAENREHYVEKRHRVKVQTPRGPQRAERRIQKPVATPDRTPKPTDFILSNGVKHTSPKRVPPAKHAMTLQQEQPHKSFAGSRRFAASPKASPCASMAASLEMGQSGVNGSHNPFQISNVFSSAPAEVTPPPALMQRSSVRINPAQKNLITMEGVFAPMRGGRAPKPSSLAPWMQDSQARANPGRRQVGTHSSQAPFAITESK